MKRGKQVIVLVIVAMLLLLATFGSSWRKSEISRFQISYLDMFDTQTEIIGYGTSQEEFENQAEKLRSKLAYYHRLYDIYNEYEGLNNIKTINDQAGIAPVKVDREIIELLKFSKEMYELTDGQMNIAMGSVLTIWHECREEAGKNPDKGKLPDMENLENAAAHTDINKITIDEERLTVYLEDPEMSLDVGSIGKGYAVQKTAEFAKEIGMENVLISVGGNISAVGTREDGTPWRVGIQNPDLSSESAYVKKLDISDASLVTSGSYQRYYEVDGVKYCHIIDGDTLMPGDLFDSVSVVTTDSGKADALSTALFNMTLEEGQDFVKQQEDVAVMWILKDGSIVHSEGFLQFVAK